MACIARNLVRIAVITGAVGALGIGAATLVAGPDRVGAFFTQTRSQINATIDSQITDPVALRAQLRDLQAQYPARIGQVRSDLAQLREQRAQLERDMAVSNRVVDLADQDSDKLTSALDHAQSATVTNVALGVEHEIVIVFRNERINLEAATTKLNQVNATRNAYASRAADIQRDLGYLTQQEGQLATLLNKLETEQTAFQTQLFDLDRQIDAIARNDRMIDVMASRQRTLDEQSRYRAASLDQINSKLADIRAKQEAQLASLANVSDHFSYEDAAKSQIDREGASAAPRKVQRATPRIAPTVIEINPDSLPALPPAPKDTPGKDGSVASNSAINR
jgi:chromosome segregation ATPase